MVWRGRLRVARFRSRCFGRLLRSIAPAIAGDAAQHQHPDRDPIEQTTKRSRPERSSQYHARLEGTGRWPAAIGACRMPRPLRDIHTRVMYLRLSGFETTGLSNPPSGYDRYRRGMRHRCQSTSPVERSVFARSGSRAARSPC
jgi:hypothetical protein